MIGCPDCGSLIAYQHRVGCKLAIMDEKRNLIRHRYPDHFLQQWRGCADLHCMPECGDGFCQRLDLAFKRWGRQQQQGRQQ